MAYWSRKIIPAEYNYATHNQELLAIVDVVAYWCYYLKGALYIFKVLSDYENLKGFIGKKTLDY